MNVLAIDTATEVLGIALSSAWHSIEHGWRAAGNHC